MHGKREEDDGDGDNEKEDEELVTRMFVTLVFWLLYKTWIHKEEYTCSKSIEGESDEKGNVDLCSSCRCINEENESAK